MRVPLWVAAVLPLAACYTYTPISDTQPEPGNKVHAYVTNDGAVDLVTKFGPGVTMLDGRLLRLNDRDMSMAVESVNTDGRGRIYWTGEALRLDRSAVMRIEQRELSVLRTALFIGAFVASSFLVDYALEGGGSPPGGEGPQEPGGVN